jgi:hypothetical protein
MSARLIVSIDTEEEGLWGGIYRPTGNSVENIRGVPRFQELCERFSIRPVYLVDSPVVEDDWSAELFRSLHEQGRAEIGAHLHPWCTPPLCDLSGERDTFLCNLAPDVQRMKLEHLTWQIARRIGRSPTSFRAGRYGLDMTGARILRELGYEVDTSVIPFSNFTSSGGPDYESAPWQPYYLDGDSISEAHGDGFLLEVPVSVGFSRADFTAAQLWRKRASLPILRRLRAVGLVDRLGLATRIKFSPEQADAHRMKALVNAFLGQRATCMVLMFHSSSLVAGLSPYVKSAGRLEEFYADLESIFNYCIHVKGMTPETLTGFARTFAKTAAGNATAGLANVH